MEEHTKKIDYAYYTGPSLERKLGGGGGWGVGAYSYIPVLPDESLFKSNSN